MMAVKSNEQCKMSENNTDNIFNPKKGYFCATKLETNLTFLAPVKYPANALCLNQHILPTVSTMERNPAKYILLYDIPD